jgi:hypothetical protein
MRSDDRPLALLQAGLAGLAGTDVAGMSDAQVHDEVAALLVCVNQLDAVLAERLGSFDSRGLSDSDAVRTTLSWLRIYARMTAPTASRVLRRARLLRDLPALAAAARAGAVSAEHLAPVLRLVKEVGIAAVRDFDGVLAGVCGKATPLEVAATCQRIYAYLNPDGKPPDPDEDFERRELSLRPHGSMLQIRGLLDPEAGAAVSTVIDALMRPPSPTDERTAPQRRADALADLARGAIARGAVPSVGGVRPSIGILVTPQTLIGTTKPSGPSTPDETERPWLTWMGEIPPELAQRIACDGDVWRIAMDPGSGLPLDVGRAHRLVPSWMRKALHARDRTCRWPGCDVPAAWTDAHHVVPWYRGGTTAIDQLTSLCRYHHVLVHEGKWRLRLDKTTGAVHVTRPDGRPYELGVSPPWTGTSRRRPHTTDPPSNAA